MSGDIKVFHCEDTAFVAYEMNNIQIKTNHQWESMHEVQSYVAIHFSSYMGQ